MPWLLGPILTISSRAWTASNPALGSELSPSVPESKDDGVFYADTIGQHEWQDGLGRLVLLDLSKEVAFVGDGSQPIGLVRQIWDSLDRDRIVV